jgi:hypothetical protein
MYRSLLFDDIECDRKARFVIGLNFFMHLSEWHPFNPRDRQTYPKVEAPIQVRYESGGVSVGHSHDFLSSIWFVVRFTDNGLEIHQGGGASWG